MEETKERKLNRKTIILIVLGILILLLIILASSHAFYQIQTSEDGSVTHGSINLECLSIDYVEEGNINLDPAYPIKDDYALVNVNPVKIRITNNCEANLEDINYALVLTTLTNGDNNITSDKIRVNSNRSLNIVPASEPSTYDNFLKSSYLASLSELTNEYSKEALESDILARKKADGSSLFEGYDIVDTRIIDENFVKNNSENVYEVQLWIDYYEGDSEVYSGEAHKSSFDNSTANKTFVGALSVVANPYEKYDTNSQKNLLYLRSKDVGNYLSTSLVGGMFRYQGLYTDDINNYICLGDNCCKTTECDADDSDDMYRIIGITQSGEIKVIKKTALTDGVKWWSDDSTDIKWPQSLIYQKLNGKIEGSTEPNSEDINSYYYSLDSKLKGLIVNEHSWLYGDAYNSSSFGYNGDTIYGIESGSSDATYYQKGDSSDSPTGKGEWSDTIDAPIGLMYLSDYYYAYKTTDSDAGKPGSSSNAKKSWIYLSHNEKTHPSNSTYSGYEWTMCRYGPFRGYYVVWSVADNGGVYNNTLDNEFALRPSFYLTSDVELSGEGSLTNPFEVYIETLESAESQIH